MAKVSERAEPDDHVRQVGRGGSLNLIAAVAAAVLGVLAAIAVARLLEQNDAGTYFAATSLVVLAACIARLGTSVGLVYWIARLRELGRTGQLVEILTVALAPVVLLSVVMSAVTFVTAPWLAEHLLGGAQSAEQVLRAVSVLIPFVVISDALLGATRGFGTMRPTAAADRVTRPMLQLVLIVVAGSVGGVVLIGAAWAVPYVITALLAGWWLRRLVSRAGPSTSPEPVELRRAFWRFTWPRAITSVVQQALQRLDIVLVTALRSPAEAALYAVATRFLVVGQLSNSALGMAAQPQVARLHASGQPQAINQVYRSTTTWVILMNGPLYLFVAAFSPLLLTVFGDEYAKAWPVTVALCAAAFLGNGAGMVDVMLSMAGRTTWTLANSVVALIVQVSVDVALIPHLGAFGAALGWGASILTANTLSLVQLAKADGLHPFERATAIAVGLTALGVGVPVAGSALAFGQTWAAALLAVGVSVVVYPVLVWRAGNVLRIDELIASLRRQRTVGP